MLYKQLCYNTLIFLTLFTFGFFGSLSHVFNLGLIFFLLIDVIRSNQKNNFDTKAILVFCFLSACFFFLFLISLVGNKIKEDLSSLGPMYPIPIIGLLLLLHGNNLKLNSRSLATFSQISVMFAYFLHLILLTYPVETGRDINLFSGNPIPFSFVILGLSIFCLIDWADSTVYSKFIAAGCFLFGIYLSGYIAGVRSATLSIILITPLTLFYIFKKTLHSVLSLISIAVICMLFAYMHTNGLMSNIYFDHIAKGLETLFKANGLESSVSLRQEIWLASIKAVSNQPIFGYGVAERFNALLPFLRSDFPYLFSHPHNDIVASLISGGFAGGFLAIGALIAPVLAATLSNDVNSKKLFFGFIVSVPIFVCASFNTVFFNDINSAWLAFSTYLIYNTKF